MKLPALILTGIFVVVFGIVLVTLIQSGASQVYIVTPTAATTTTPTTSSIAWKSLGIAAKDVDDWTISITRYGAAKTLIRNDGKELTASGVFWFLDVKATNNRNESRALNDFDWVMLDTREANYRDITSQDQYADIDTLQTESLVSAMITPRGTTQALLLFDVAQDSTPNGVVVSTKPYSPDGFLFTSFDLTP